MEIYRHQVQYYETDKMSFTHHSNYIRFMEEARIDFLNQIGWGYDKMEEEGIISPVISVTCDYKKSTTFPEIIEITIQVLELTGTKLKLGYVMKVDGTVVCTATSGHCFLDESGRPVIIKRKYPDFYKTLKKLLERE